MTRRTVLLLALLVVSAGFAARQWPHGVSPPVPEPVLVIHGKPQFALEDESPAFRDGIQTALIAGDYAALEAQAAALRAPAALFRSGVPKLVAFYEALTAFETFKGADGCNAANPLSLKQAAARLDRWHGTAPASRTAQIALAQLWTNAAWDARGCGRAPEVSLEAWGAVNIRLIEAERTMAQIDLNADPMGYYVAIQIGALRSFDRDHFDSLYNRAILAFPRFFPFYSQRAHFLQAKWFGADGELAGYLNALRDPAQGADGQIAYSFAVAKIFTSCICDRIYTELGQTLPQIMAAYQVREERYGLRNKDWNTIFALAIHGGACEPAHQALLQIGDRWNADVWQEKQYFDANVAWFHAHSRY